MEYNERIKHYRTQKGVTQQQLADEIDVSRQSVTRWENGFSVPSMYYAQKLSDYFGVTVTELMTGSAESAPKENHERDMRVKCVTATVKFCVAAILTVIVYALLCNLIYALNYYFVQNNGDTDSLRFTIKAVYGVVDGLVIAALAVMLAVWIMRLVSWLNTADDKYSRYRIYKPWNIGLAAWLTCAVTVVLLIYANIVTAVLLFIAAAFISVPLDFIIDFTVKKALGNRMVVPRNRTLDIINLVYAVIAALCVTALTVWIVYAVVSFYPSCGLEIGFAILYFCIAAVVIEISYVIVRITVFSKTVRHANTKD